MAHRTVEVLWQPRSPKQWAVFTATRLEAARLWRDLVVRHHRLRRLNWKWPNETRWNAWARGKYPNLSAQSAQQVIGEFLENVRATTANRKAGNVHAKYPWRTPKYRDVTYTNQDAKIKNGYLRMGNGKQGPGALVMKMPKGLTLPGKLMEVQVEFGRVLLICKVDDAKPVGGSVVVGVDLGVNTLAAATDGQKAVLVSGRAAKATIQYRNKKLAQISAKQAGRQRGSRRFKRLQRRKYAMLGKTRRRIRDLCHKASRKIVEAFPGARIVVGEPFNDAAQKLRRTQAQQVSQTCTRKLIQMLDYKARGAIVVPESYSSQTCPVCGCRQKCRRTYRCGSCGFQAPRDVVGAWNIRQIGMGGGMVPTPTMVSPQATFVHPTKYPGPRRVVRAEPPHVAQGA